ncbi:MAG: GNAT family N-acetyltransferase [bacterium]|nr:GNAT family N-acetyltransferase [bacterium]
MSEHLKNKAGPESKVFFSPDDLPEKWDEAFGLSGLFCHKKTLKHLFATSPLKQEYFSAGNPGKQTLNGTVCRSNLPFAVGPITIYRPAAICSLPMPFSTDPGFSDVGRLKEVADIMNRFWKGFQLITGLGERGEDIRGWSWRRHFPTVDLDIKWDSFDEYLESFRSDYKSRITETMKRGQELKSCIITPDRFDEKTYDLYVAVARRYHSIVLPRDYFVRFPVKSYILGLEADGIVFAWAFLVPKGRYLYFLFGGFNEKFNNAYSIYNNLLLAIVRFSIENKYEKINLGQTAELSKMRIGGYPVERYQLVRHTDPIINQILQKTDIFEYRKHYPKPNVFKKMTEIDQRHVL